MEAVEPLAAGKESEMKRTLMQVTGLAALEGQWLRRRHFDEEMLAHLGERIRLSEQSHTGELVIAIEAVMPTHEKDPHLRALEVYGRLKVWDTPLNSGVLLYLALDQRAIEIISDRGITATSAQWQQICDRLKERFACGDYIEGLLATVEQIERVLLAHAPKGDHQADVLANEPVIL